MDQTSATTLREVGMPLAKGKSRKAASTNIKRMMQEGRSQPQAIAIALRKAGKAKMTGKSGAKHYRKGLGAK